MNSLKKGHCFVWWLTELLLFFFYPKINPNVISCVCWLFPFYPKCIYFCASPKPGPRLPTSKISHGLFLCSMICSEMWLFVLLLTVELLTITVYTLFRWEVIVCFVDIGGIDDHHCLNFLYVRGDCFFVDICGIEDHYC